MAILSGQQDLGSVLSVFDVCVSRVEYMLVKMSEEAKCIGRTGGGGGAVGVG